MPTADVLKLHESGTTALSSRYSNAGRFNLSSNAELTRIYTNPSMFFDVTHGICGPYAGYWAAPGWDFCAGIGSPAGRGIL